VQVGSLAGSVARAAATAAATASAPHPHARTRTERRRPTAAPPGRVALGRLVEGVGRCHAHTRRFPNFFFNNFPPSGPVPARRGPCCRHETSALTQKKNKITFV